MVLSTFYHNSALLFRWNQITVFQSTNEQDLIKFKSKPDILSDLIDSFQTNKQVFSQTRKKAG
jgi:hypothetical protein